MRCASVARAAGPPTVGKGMAAAICGLAALAQALLLSHAALVAHRTCALHGESVHTVAPRSPAGPLPSHSSVRPTATDDDGHEHEHCLCIGQGRERSLPSPLARDGSLVPTLSAPRAMASVGDPAAAIALWALAPKHSPPA